MTFLMFGAKKPPFSGGLLLGDQSHISIKKIIPHIFFHLSLSCRQSNILKRILRNTSGNVFMHIMDHEILVRQPGFDHIALGYDPMQFTVFENRQMTQTLIRHNT